MKQIGGGHELARWNFGQTVAVLSWLPVIAEFVFVLWCKFYAIIHHSLILVPNFPYQLVHPRVLSATYRNPPLFVTGKS